MMSASWSNVLDLYERALLDFEDGLRAGDKATLSFDFRLPEGLGPLPAELADAAAAVAEHAGRVEDQVRDAMAATAREQATVARARSHATRTRPPARFIDVEG
jgi:hypothetical protein